MVVSPRTPTWPSTVLFQESYGGRTHVGVAPVTAAISDWARSIWLPTCGPVSVLRSGWLHVWFSTG